MRTPLFAALVAGALAGCQSPPEPVVVSPPLNIRTAPALTDATPVHTSRYVKEYSVPAQTLTDMLATPIDVHLPVMGNMKVQDGMAFLLKGSGVRLRVPLSYAESQLYLQTLPLSQTDMGHMTLREALQVMGGPAFLLEEDIVKREVGFRLKTGYVWDKPTRKANVGLVGTSEKNTAITEFTPAQKSVTRSQSKPTQPSVTLAQSTMQSTTSKRSPSLDSSGIDVLYTGDGRPVTSDITAFEAKKDVEAKKEALVPSGLVTTSKPVKALPTYKVSQGESYRQALTRWVHRAGYERIAFAQEPEFLTSLDKVASRDFVKVGSLFQAVATLSQSTPELNSLTLYPEPRMDLVAFHPWRRHDVTVFDAEGESLQAAVKQAVEHYHWHWDDVNSWRAPDYAFTPYPIVTIDDDVSSAMRILLSAYPLKAQRLDATKTFYIQETSDL
ncbi:hypothetical protein AAFX24_17475 [Vibrio mediterranei]|uniref:hypothetical protein n=1 Tax=Vibrio mediterranei TaxID=689 RepID=UPI0038CF0E1E